MDGFLLVLRVGLALAVVVVLLWMAQKRASKGGHPGAGAAVEVVGRRSVGQKASVVVVESNGQRFLLGVTEHSINVLHTADAPLREPDAATADDPVFSEVLMAAGGPSRHRAAVPRRMNHPTAQGTGALHGSIFARSTWSEAGAAVRKGLNL